MHVMILYQKLKSHETLLSGAFFGKSSDCCSGNTVYFTLRNSALTFPEKKSTCHQTET